VYPVTSPAFVADAVVGGRMKIKKLELEIAEAVRAACLKAAQVAHENAGISGLCEEGRWECAAAAIRSLDLAPVIGVLPAVSRQ
jgi:hypothetical protein